MCLPSPLQTNRSALPPPLPVTDTSAPIAVFDSGGGGIGVLRALVRRMPWESFLYFGDSKNAPYGERTDQEIHALVTAHATRLLKKAKALVLACNTATAVAADTLRSSFPCIPIIGIEPAVRPALAITHAPHVLVLATDATCHSARFLALCKRLIAEKKGARLTVIAAGGLVRLVEEGELESEKTLAYLDRILAELRDDPPHAVVLGCTHFAFAHAALRRCLGDIPLFDGAVGTAAEAARRLAAADLLRLQQNKAGTVHLTSSLPAALPLYERLLRASLPFD